MEDYGVGAASRMQIAGGMMGALQSAVMPLRDSPWTLRAIVERAAETLRHGGVKALWFRVLGELGYRRAVLFELDLARYRRRDAIPAGVRFEVLSASSLEDFLGLVSNCDEREARRRFEADQVCVLGYVGGKPAYSSSFAPGPVRIDYFALHASPSPGAVYTYDVYVDPAFRGLGLSNLGMDFRVKLLRERGFSKCVSVVVPENRAGTHHTLSCDFQPIGWVRCLSVGRLKRCWIRTSVEPAPLRLAG